MDNYQIESYSGAEMEALFNKIDNLGNASQSTDGLMSAADKTKLDGLDSGAQANVLEGVKIAGADLPITEKKVNIPADSSPTSGSNSLVRSGGVFNAIKDFITRSVNDLVYYYTKSETYTKTEVNNIIGSLNQFHYEIYASTSAVTNPKSNVLYLIGPTGTGSDKYEEYVYSNGWVKIGDTTIDLSGYPTTEQMNAAINNALKDYATKEEVSQLGQYDISVAKAVGNAPAVYDSLRSAIGTNGVNIPAEVRCGGMEIRFILNKGTLASPVLEYVRYRYMSDSVANADIVNLDNWSVYPTTIEMESVEFLEVHTDEEGRILWGTKASGDFYFANGIPSQIEEEFDRRLSNKVDKVAGKALIPEQYIEEPQSAEFLKVVKDGGDKLLEALQMDGTKIFFGNQRVVGSGVFEKDIKVFGKTSLKGSDVYFGDSPEWMLCALDNQSRVLFGIKRDATLFTPSIQSPTIDALVKLIVEGENSIQELRAAIENNASYHQLHPHGPALFFIDDDGGQYFPEIWDEIMGRTGIRVGIACIAGMMSGAVTPLPAYVQMTIEQLRGYYEAGCEVYSHSWSHRSFRNAVTLEELDEECRKSKDWLMANGFTRNADAIVYPGGMNVADSPAKKDVIRRYYRYGVATIDSYEGVNREPLDELFISRCQGDAWSLERLKGLVDVAVAEKKMLGVMTHAYELMGYGSTPYSDNKQENIDRIVAMIEYAQSKGMNIRPMEEIIHQIYGWDFRSNVF